MEMELLTWRAAVALVEVMSGLAEAATGHLVHPLLVKMLQVVLDA